MKKCLLVMALIAVSLVMFTACENTPEVYTVTFDKNEGGDGTMVTTQTFTEGIEQALTANSFTAPSGRSVFKGWNTDSEAAVATFTDKHNYTATKDITLYAIWEADTYKITFKANNGTGNNTTQEFTEGKSQALTGNSFTGPSRKSKFVGWATTTDGQKVYDDKEQYTATADIKLYAIWEADTYTVTFNSNIGNSPATTTQKFTEAREKELAANSFKGLTGTSKFVGWATTTDGQKAYDDKEQYTATADITLYAIWEADTYTVTFNANGGGGGPMTSQSFTEGTTQTLTTNTFTGPTEKCKFLGWNTDKNATTASYTDEANYKALKSETLYAIWGEYEVGDTGPAGGIIFYDVDEDNNDEHEGRGPDNLSSATNEASGDMLANWRYLEAAAYDIKIDDNGTEDDETDDTVSLGTSNNRTNIPFAYYRAEGGGGDNMYVYGTDPKDVGNHTLTDKGTGASNTEKLVAAMKADGSQAFTSTNGPETTAHYAANVCSKLEVGKYENWFLPSIDELNLMHKNLQEE